MYMTAMGQFSLGVNTTYIKALNANDHTILGDNRGYEIYDITYLGQSNSYSIGLVGYADNERLYFMAAANYAASVHNFQLMDHINESLEHKKVSVTRQILHMPITAGVKYHQFRVGMGPDLIMQLDRQEGFSVYEGIDVREGALRTGFHIMLGYDPIPQIKCSMSYEVGFYNLADDLKYGGKSIPLDATPRMFNFSLAFLL